MSRAFHGIGLQEVVRTDAGANEAAKQRLEDRRVVVDARQKDRLIHHREACVGERLARSHRLARQLARMIEMRHHPQRMVPA